MSAIISSWTTNWFGVKDEEQVRTIVDRLNEGITCLDYGEEAVLHEHDGRYRLTLYEAVGGEFGYYCEEEGETLDAGYLISECLSEGEVLRVTSISWFKGRISWMGIDVYTSDGRSASRSLQDLEDSIAKQLDVDRKKLDGWP